MNLNLQKLIKESFALKVFVTFTVFISVISFFLTAFFIHHQTKSISANLIKDGTLLSKILAYNSRIGVFSESGELIKDAIDGVLVQKGVLEVMVFNLEGQLLGKKRRDGVFPGKSVEGPEGGRNKIFEKLKNSKTSFCLEDDNKLEFWSPVISGSHYLSEEALFFDADTHKGGDGIIGFVNVTIAKEAMKKQINDLLFKSILMGIAFLMMGSGIVYIIAKGVTMPLNKLTEDIKTFGIEGIIKNVEAETEDEIGKLAKAFNDMSESLKRRELEKGHLEEQLRQSQKMEAIGTLAGGIAHDFNNILTTIIGYVDILQAKMGEDSPLTDHVEQILASAERAVTLIQNLLLFSRKQISKPGPINLNENIKNIKKLLAKLIREDIEFRLELTGDDLIIMADSGQIDQTLMNLVANARDAMPAGGILTIATESVEMNKEAFMADNRTWGRYALLSVIDTGEGMNENTMERIFNPFFTTKEVGKGTGLGLSMIYGIVKQHKGYIDVLSKPDKGTTFKIYLPLIESKIENKKSKSLPFPEGGTETVLVAEDDEDIRTLSKIILEQNGYNVIEAIDGEDAVSKFIKNKEKIQLLILDVIMPKKDGKEAYEEIRKMRVDIKVLFISGYTSDLIDKRGIIEEGGGFLYKPFSSEILLQKIRQVLDSNS
ncbi:MAG: ATP-binding protein [Thermodesulfobacteriota bacterium]|nr:ATP-binding protein [Thermodesulfobacteriota bacterium]